MGQRDLSGLTNDHLPDSERWLVVKAGDEAWNGCFWHRIHQVDFSALPVVRDPCEGIQSYITLSGRSDLRRLHHVPEVPMSSTSLSPVKRSTGLCHQPTGLGKRVVSTVTRHHRLRPIRAISEACIRPWMPRLPGELSAAAGRGTAYPAGLDGRLSSRISGSVPRYEPYIFRCRHLGAATLCP